MAQPRRRRGAAPQTGKRREPRAGWRATVDSFGGFLVIGGIGGTLIAIAVLVWVSRPSSTSDDPLLGEAIAIGEASHVDSLEQMEIVAGRPPVGGPHFPRWQATGSYDEPVSDGLAVHALEHGVVWISYKPTLVSDADLSVLRALARDYPADTILSPRSDNTMAIAAASWGRLLSLDGADREALRQFVETNRNRSPEPGVR